MRRPGSPRRAWAAARRSGGARRRRGCGRARSAGRSRRDRAPSPARRRGRRCASPCFTAAMFVTAPPMPTTSVGRRAAARRPSSLRSPCAPREYRLGDGAREPEPLGEAHRADVDAEPLVDPDAVAERELRAAAAGVEDDERAVAQRQRGAHRQVGEAALLLAGDDLDADAAALPRSRRAPRRVRRDPQPGGPDRRDRHGTCRRGLLGHAGDRLHGARDRLGRDRARLLEALAEPRDLGAIGDRRHVPSALALADVELDRVRADVDDRVPRARRCRERLQPARACTMFRSAASPSSRTAATHARRILGLHRDRPRGPPSAATRSSRPCSRRCGGARAACAPRPRARRRALPRARRPCRRSGRAVARTYAGSRAPSRHPPRTAGTAPSAPASRARARRRRPRDDA